MCYTIGLENLRHFFIQSQVKLKPVVTCPHLFSRPTLNSNFDWFIAFSMAFVIGYSDYLGFGFSTLNRNVL